MTTEQSDMRHRLKQFQSALSSFTSSPSTFQIISSIPTRPSPPPPQTLYVLDSSFNPPTLAHLRIATSALAQDRGAPPKRLLLLLATQNADKPAKPASFEQRLAMMTIFAEDLRKACWPSRSASVGREDGVEGRENGEGDTTDEDGATIDIAVTKHPYFIDKASAIISSGAYPPQVTQVHLVGYDTLIRLLDPKYYPPTHTLAPLEPFLGKHRLRVTYRTDADWGDREKQEEYLRRLAAGDREREGGRREWAGRIEFVEGRREGEEVVSSTKVREAAKKGDKEMLGKLVTQGVAEWVLQERLYVDD